LQIPDGTAAGDVHGLILDSVLRRERVDDHDFRPAWIAQPLCIGPSDRVGAEVPRFQIDILFCTRNRIQTEGFEIIAAAEPQNTAEASCQN